ncbi:hypothetical protein [Actinomadura rugatobispora]|uniref:Carboxymuconolactone decarboxylase family protein n=1 Tax=Actinomadura rugatobispora TaxID=1994 RepID=A0ABW1A4D0_9ACTN|nr:hypothetical protein GCM10010200_083370 [Actinomadura rugatobispora]
MPDGARENAILAVAAQRDADFERFAHEPIARSVGLTGGQLFDIRVGDCSLNAHEALVADAVRRADDGDLPVLTFDELHRTIGLARLFELTTLVGHYILLALQLRVLQAPARGQVEPSHH